MSFVKSMYKLIKEFGYRVRDDYVNAFSAQAAFFIFLSFFPFIMFLLSLLDFLPIEADEVVDWVLLFLPSSSAIADFVMGVVEELIGQSSGAILSLSIVATVWSASSGLFALTRGMNAVYNHKETRNFILIRSLSYLYTLFFAIMLAVLAVFLVFGNRVYSFILEYFPNLSIVADFFLTIRSLLTMVVMTVVFTAMYCILPNRKTTILKELPGALIASAGWLGFSFLFSYYIDHYADYSKTYGSLTAIIICMLWLFICMYILFIGAEINSVIIDEDFRKNLEFLITYRRSRYEQIIYLEKRAKKRAKREAKLEKKMKDKAALKKRMATVENRIGGTIENVKQKSKKYRPDDNGADMSDVDSVPVPDIKRGNELMKMAQEINIQDKLQEVQENNTEALVEQIIKKYKNVEIEEDEDYSDKKIV